MIRVFSICLIVLVAAVGYTQLTKQSAHDEAVAHLKRQLAEGSTIYTAATCNTTPSPPNQFALAAFGSGVTLFDCHAVSADRSIQIVCEAVGGSIPSNAAAFDNGQKCSQFGSMPSLPTGVTPGAGSTPAATS